MNAISHGLTTQPVYDEKIRERIDQLTNIFAQGSEDHPEIIRLASEAAEAQVMLERIRDLKIQAWSNATRDPGITKRGKLHDLIESEVAIVGLVIKQLSRYIRYERQAANRRDRALRDLEEQRPAKYG